jgi:methylmalonyl-CoA/ethylmalonyl-CoA epimerase
MEPALSLTHIAHVCIVVRDIQDAMGRYWKNMGIGPWKVRTSSAPPMVATYHGRPSYYKAKMAQAQAGSVILEFAQHLEGEDVYRDFLEERGEGVHHMGVYVPNLDEALAPFLAKGVAILQSGDGTGLTRDGRYAYLGTEAMLGTILEVIQAPSQRGEPEYVYP